MHVCYWNERFRVESDGRRKKFQCGFCVYVCFDISKLRRQFKVNKTAQTNKSMLKNTSKKSIYAFACKFIDFVRIRSCLRWVRKSLNFRRKRADRTHDTKYYHTKCIAGSENLKKVGIFPILFKNLFCAYFEEFCFSQKSCNRSQHEIEHWWNFEHSNKVTCFLTKCSTERFFLIFEWR